MVEEAGAGLVAGLGAGLGVELVSVLDGDFFPQLVRAMETPATRTKIAESRRLR